jgi:hypothetical protein
MRRLRQDNGWLLVALFLLMICASSALAIRDDYSIEFDLNDAVVQGSGTGYGGGAAGPWYYYPHSGEYIQWFYNDPFDPARMSNIELWVFIESVQHDQFYYVDIKFGWTKPAWNLDHPNAAAPPSPSALSSSAKQAQYLHTEVIKSMDKSKNWMLEEGGSIEPRANYTVNDYNPQWLFISVKGSNARVHRFVTHDCVAGGGSSPGGEDDPFGACCNRQTGTCYQAKQADCSSPNQWWELDQVVPVVRRSTPFWILAMPPVSFPFC